MTSTDFSLCVKFLSVKMIVINSAASMCENVHTYALIIIVFHHVISYESHATQRLLDIGPVCAAALLEVLGDVQTGGEVTRGTQVAFSIAATQRRSYIFVSPGGEDRVRRQPGGRHHGDT